MEEKIACDNCGSVYRLRYEKVPYKDSDFVNCEVCGTKVYSWNVSRTYYIDLLEKKENHLKK
jgi:predicted Zn finger-like uncharacterized protein